MPARWAIGVLVAALAAFGAAAFRRPLPAAPAAAPPAPAPLPVVTAAELKARIDAREDVFLVFVGTESFFQERRIPGARCVEYSQLASAFAGFERSREIILYCGCCGDAAEGVSGMAVRALRSLGFQRVSHLEGHYAGWARAGYAVEGSRPASPDERAYANDAQRAELERFESEAARNRTEREAAREAEKDPSRRAELERMEGAALREEERRGLLLKRRLALEAGDPAKAAAVDRILKAKASP